LQSKLITMTGEELLQQLLTLKEEWGTLDVPICVFKDEDRHEIGVLDLFTNGVYEKRVLHSIDINV